MDYDHLPSVLLLSSGWDYDWPDFYPDDMPQAWRLGYYSNGFRAVLVPTAQLEEGGDFGQWLDEVNEQFLFFFESDSPPALMQLARQQLGQQFGGLIGDGDACIGYSDNLDLLVNVPAVRCFRLGADTPLELPRMKAVAETLSMRGQSGMPSLLIIEGEPPDFNRLEQCRTLLDLMGIA